MEENKKVQSSFSDDKTNKPDINNKSGIKDSENKKVIVIKRKVSNPSNPRFNKRNVGKPNTKRPQSEYVNEIIEIKRVVKVAKGGRRFRFSVLMIAGDKKGKIGYGIGKANEIPIAARKARSKAEKSLIKIKFEDSQKTIPHEVKGKFGASTIYMFPAKKGTGIIAGGSARNVLTFSGIQNIYTKCHGSRNKLNLIKATINALSSLRTEEDYNKLRFNKEQ